MKLQKGFSLIELMVSMGIVVTVVAIATGALMQAEHATTAVSYHGEHARELARRNAFHGSRPDAGGRRNSAGRR